MMKKRFVALTVVFLLVFSMLVVAKLSAPPSATPSSSGSTSANPAPAGMVELSEGKYVHLENFVQANSQAFPHVFFFRHLSLLYLNG